MLTQECTCGRCGREYEAELRSRHRLLCGDATEPAALARLLGADTADLVWTDPPYGVSYAEKTGRGIANDHLQLADLTDFLRKSFAAALEVCKPGAVWYVAAPHGPAGLAFATILHELDVWRSSLVWIKDTLVLSRLDYHYKHECLYYGWKPGGKHRAVPDRSQTSVFECPRPKRSAEHPTMKPVELIRRHVANSSLAGEIVLDMFAGSGSTLIACEQTGRRGMMLELEPAFADVIVERWQQFTGRRAQRLAAGAETAVSA